MRYDIVHRTRYDYDDVVTASFAEVHLLPDDVDGQRCIQRDLVTDPAPDHLRERRDWWGNLTTTVTIREPHQRLTVTSAAVVDTSGRLDALTDAHHRRWESVASEAGASLEVAEFTFDSPRVRRSDALAAFARPSFGADTPIGPGALDLAHRVHREFTFDTDATEVDTPLEDVLATRSGVCQDFAHIMVGALRSIGLAACYVSGYLETDPPPGKARLTGADRTHAWVGVYVGDGEWIGVDPTNDQLAGGRYVTAARGRDYGDIPPLKGVIFTEATESSLTVAVDVVPVPTGR